METLVILALTVAVVAGVVWWMTTAESIAIWPRRRDLPPDAAEAAADAADEERRAESEDAKAASSGFEEQRKPLVPHASPSSAYPYLPAQTDDRPPAALSLLRLVLAITVVAALFAGGIWFLGQFVNSTIARLVGQ